MPQQLAHYRIEELLGEGTFAWVYRAFDQKLERDVALKMLKPAWLSDPQAIARFEREARTMARLHHPHIVQVYDVDQADGQVYLAQFLVEGETLAKRLAGGPLGWSTMLDLLRRVASALDYAHRRGVIHRDIKPSNILLGEEQQVYLSDFCLAGAAEGSTSVSASSGGMIGTASYLAPEQWRGEKPTAATDVYALSCVIVEMLSGRVLFDGPTPPAIMTKHVLDGPKLPAIWPAGVPEGVTRVLQHGLARNRAERPGSAAELVTKLEGLVVRPQPAAAAVKTKEERLPVAESSSIPKPSSGPLPKLSSQPAPTRAPAKPSRQNWLVIGGILALLVFGLIICIFTYNFLSQTQLSTPVSQPPARPIAIIASPRSDTTIAVGQEIIIYFTATDVKGISQVELWVDGQPIHVEKVNRPVNSFATSQAWTPEVVITF